MEALPAEHRPHKPSGPDPKWRFFWRIGPRPDASNTQFPDLNAKPVKPAAFPEWEETMDGWGNKMLAATESAARMLALGFGMEREGFTKLMHCGPHLLAPTGSDLSRYGQVDTIFAGWHTDLNFLTIHGKSRFPGLYVWLANGTKMPVKVPDGCLLMQAGQQMEYLTGGYVKAGYHEVVVDDKTVAAVERAQKEDRSLWRISSTMFATICHDQTLQALPEFRGRPGCTPEKYPPILSGHQVENELKSIALAK